MSFPLDIIPMMDLVTERPVATEREGAEGVTTTPTEDRICEWRAGMDPESLTEKPLPNEKPLPSSPLETTKAKKAWRKVKETFRPDERQKRRAKEFDEMMRRNTEELVAADDAVSLKTMVAGRVQEHGMMSMASLGRIEGQDAEPPSRLQGIKEEEEGITALPPMPAHLLGQTPMKKEKRRLVKKTKSMTLYILRRACEMHGDANCGAGRRHLRISGAPTFSAAPTALLATSKLPLKTLSTPHNPITATWSHLALCGEYRNVRKFEVSLS
ncbi:hypothetical protein BKA63DRAFT_495915 [Paraphoma chrysanthemicola]|nr:hypothetical protein BKA63DRAFT_495915 [Paraphoma chrysanthemicola]